MSEAKLVGNTYKVLDFIQHNPGCHLRQIKKELKISMGSVQYHLYQLEKMRRITSIRHGLYKYYFLSEIFQNYEKDILQVLSQEAARDILMFIIERKNPTQTDIVNYRAISAASVNWHIRRLIDFGIICELREAKYKRYQICSGSDYSKNIVALLKNYYPSIWDKWSSRLAEMFLPLSNESSSSGGGDSNSSNNNATNDKT